MNFHFRVEAYDGSVALPSANSAGHDLTLKILRREALTRVLTHPGELGVARAYVAGDLDIDGELDALFDLKVPPLRSLLKIEKPTSAAVGRRRRHPSTHRATIDRGQAARFLAQSLA